ncbi:MAG: twin-arginine translocase TatA/TatE family subunit [Leptotrichiaceae bacterium]|nr:twin-arginine translocase TatA/TatE family subunit [Leptotrichiaceae bacterium]
MGFFRDIGTPGMVVLILGALLIFGPKRLPELGRSVGKMLSEFKKSMSEISGENDDKNDDTEKDKTDKDV